MLASGLHLARDRKGSDPLGDPRTMWLLGPPRQPSPVRCIAQGIVDDQVLVAELDGEDALAQQVANRVANGGAPAMIGGRQTGGRGALPRQNCSRIMIVASPELLPQWEPGRGRDEAGKHCERGRVYGGRALIVVRTKIAESARSVHIRQRTPFCRPPGHTKMSVLPSTDDVTRDRPSSLRRGGPRADMPRGSRSKAVNDVLIRSCHSQVGR